MQWCKCSWRLQCAANTNPGLIPVLHVQGPTTVAPLYVLDLLYKAYVDGVCGGGGWVGWWVGGWVCGWVGVCVCVWGGMAQLILGPVGLGCLQWASLRPADMPAACPPSPSLAACSGDPQQCKRKRFQRRHLHHQPPALHHLECWRAKTTAGPQLFALLAWGDKPRHQLLSVRGWCGIIPCDQRCRWQPHANRRPERVCRQLCQSRAKPASIGAPGAPLQRVGI